MSETINVAYLLQTLEVDDVRDVIKEALHEGESEVLFTKVNGETRLMKCTLRMEDIPTDKHPAGGLSESNSNYSTEALRVFDTDLNEWRSFRVANVKSVRQL